MTEMELTKGDLVDFRLLANKILQSNLIDASDRIDLRKAQSVGHKLWQDSRVPEEVFEE